MGNGRFGKGYVPDTHDKSKDRSTRHLFGAVVSLPAAASLEKFVMPPGVRDQQQTSSCTGFAFARAIHLRCAAMGTPIAWPSPTGIYTVGRMLDEGRAITDEGAQPSQVMLGCQRWGVPGDLAWPPGGFDAAYAAHGPDFINDLPDLAELEDAAGLHVQAWYRIDGEGAARLVDVKQALAEGYPVAIGTMVDQAFEDYAGKGNVTAPVPADELGGHMMCICGYEPDPAHPGHSRFRGVNSWGTAWGDGGLYWADEAFILAPEMSDIYVVTATAAAR